MAKVTIGIPLYNRAAYVGECARSLFEQSYGDIEYLFIDDGSTDGSVDALQAVLEAYPQRAAATRVITHERNQGLAATRNHLIDEARGEYVTFCDADDWLDLDCIATMVAAAERDDADVVAAGMYENHRPMRCDFSRGPNAMTICAANLSVCNKLIRRTLLNDYALRVPQGINCWEDVSLTARALAVAARTSFIDRPFYHYRKENQASYTASSSNQKERMRQQVECARFIDAWLAERGLAERFEPFLLHLKFASKIKMLSVAPRTLRLWQSTFPEANRRIMANDTIALPYRLLFQLAAWL